MRCKCEEVSHIKIDTSSGAVVTNITLVDALYERMAKQKQDIEAKEAAQEAAKWAAGDKGPKADIRRLLVLAP